MSPVKHAIVLLAVAAATTALAPRTGSLPHRQHACSNVTFNITTSANNVIFSPSPDPTNETSILQFLDAAFNGNLPEIIGTNPVSGTFSIGGTYCVPHRSVKTKPDTLEVLIHGITYNKAAWSGLGFGDQYNWHKQANDRGYATLAIDRLGNGLSSHPDPITFVQPALEVAILNQIVQSIRGSPPHSPSPSHHKPPHINNNNNNNPLHQTYRKIILIGHSYGSFLAPGLTTLYPSTPIAALVLTGFSTTFSLSALAAQSWSTASTSDPVLFSHLRGQPGYVAQNIAAEREAAYYAGGYDTAIPRRDFDERDTAAVGSFGGLGVIMAPAVGYTQGDVLVVTGELDHLVCGAPVERCREDLERSRRDFFPGLRAGGEVGGENKEGEGGGKGKGKGEGGVYQYYIPRNTGHDIMLHYTAKETMGKVHDWLDERF